MAVICDVRRNRPIRKKRAHRYEHKMVLKIHYSQMLPVTFLNFDS